jgi:hypothetical protein
MTKTLNKNNGGPEEIRTVPLQSMPLALLLKICFDDLSFNMAADLILRHKRDM